MPPGNTVAGVPFTPSVRVVIQDAAGVTVSTATMAVTLGLGTNPGGATLSGPTTVNAAAGIATFSGVSLDKSASGYTLVANAAGLSGAISAPFTVQPAIETQLGFVVPPTDAVAGMAIGPPIQVTIQDAFGNTVGSSTAAVTLTLGADPGAGGTLSANTTLGGTTIVTAVSGVATFSDVSIERAATGYTLVASADPLAPATSPPFAIAPAAKAKLAFVVPPSAVSGGEPITPAVQVAVQDAFGNTVTDATDNVTLAIATNPRGGTLVGTLTVAAAQGIAIFSDLRVDEPGSGYTLSGSAAALSPATSAPFSIMIPFAGVSAGIWHTCGITTKGVAYCWGNNQYGQLGDGTATLYREIPVRVAGGLSFRTVTAGGYHTCGITMAGETHCWGFNGYGQLGTGTIGGTSASPALVVTSLTFVAVSAGGFHTCGLTADGAAHCWGDNSSGQLGDGTTTRSPSPTDVAGGLTFAALTTGGATYGNPSHTCGVTAGGAAYCWGHNQAGQLGDGTTVARSVPAPVTGGFSFAVVRAGGGHTCAVAASGATFCWGYNGARQVGDGTTTDQSSPVPVTGNLSLATVSPGYSHTCGTSAGGAAYCWGSNGSGERGDGTNNNPRSSPGLVAGGLTFTALSSSQGFHACGVTPAGRAYCWGNNVDGQLGDGTRTDRFVPVRVVE